MTTPEQRVVEACVKFAESLGYLCRKVVCVGRRGFPDYLFVNPDGLIFFIEFKAPGETPKPWQARELSRLADQGCHVFVIDNIEGGLQLIKSAANSEAFVREMVGAAEEAGDAVAQLSDESSQPRH